jgi:hypothetical protein
MEKAIVDAARAAPNCEGSWPPTRQSTKALALLCDAGDGVLLGVFGPTLSAVSSRESEIMSAPAGLSRTAVFAPWHATLREGTLEVAEKNSEQRGNHMSTSQSLRVFYVCLLTLPLLGCGGSGGDDDDEEEFVPEDESAAGVWRGTLTLAGSSPRTFNLLVAENGQFAGTADFAPPTAPTVDSGRLLVGTGTVSGSSVTASGTTHANPGQALPNSQPSGPLTVSGTVREGASLTGTYSAAGETGSLNLQYRTQSNRPGSLATLAGVYTSLPNSSGSTATVTVTSSGQATWDSLGVSGVCVGNGTFTVPSAAQNVYAWSFTLNNCGIAGSYSGLASLDDFQAASNNILVMVGAKADRGFAFAGTR